MERNSHKLANANCDTPSMALSRRKPDSRAACGAARHPEGDPRGSHCGAIFCRGKVQELEVDIQ